MGLKQELDNLKAYTQLLSVNAPKNTDSKNKKLAFWINVYNAFTLLLVTENYPIKSIKDLYDGKPWDVQWIEIGANNYSLNNIENGIIRPMFGDARIHFAVNCAAKSCPPLLNKAYTESNVNYLLDQQTNKFINNREYNILSSNPIQISKIFDWYLQDFGEIIPYLNRYSEYNLESNVAVEYMLYDWSLNE
jgi:hypothetical protein